MNRKERLLKALEAMKANPYAPIDDADGVELTKLGFATRETVTGIGATFELHEITPAGEAALAKREIPSQTASVAQRLFGRFIGLRPDRRDAVAEDQEVLPPKLTAHRQTYPIMLVQDRYRGTYSGGDWIAIAEADKPCGLVQDAATSRCGYLVSHSGAIGDDVSAMAFWADPPDWIAVGATPEDAIANLRAGVRPKGWNAESEKPTSH